MKTSSTICYVQHVSVPVTLLTTVLEAVAGLNRPDVKGEGRSIWESVDRLHHAATAWAKLGDDRPDRFEPGRHHTRLKRQSDHRV